MGALEMIRSAVDFQQIQGQSRARAHPALLVRYRRNELGQTRFGISTGRRVGSAVIRNRIRRRIREVLRTLSPRIESGWDILIVARPPAAEAAQSELAAILERLIQQAGLLVTETNGSN
jgi:ribonuclease P protein component